MPFLFAKPNLVLRGRPASEMGFDDFLELEVNVMLNDDFEEGRKHVNIGIIEGTSDGEEAKFYLKRTFRDPRPHLFRQLSAFRNPHSSARCEAIAVEQIERAGLEIMEVVASGERKFLGLPVASFLISRKVDGELLSLAFQDLPPEQRAAAVREYGGILAGLHDSGFFHRLKFNDVIYRKTGEKTCELVIIDRDVISPYPKKLCRRSLAIRNAASNCRLLVKKHAFTTSEMRICLSAYKKRSKLFRKYSKLEWFRLVKKKLIEMVGRRPIDGKMAAAGWKA